jgi:NitT/TauT family transport system substrate-binding protein
LTQLTLSNAAIKKIAAKGVTQNSPVADKIRALKGMTLALPTAGSGTDTLIRTVLEKYGLNPSKDVTIEPIADSNAMVTQVEEGRADGYAFSPPTSTQAEAQGWGAVWINFATGAVPSIAGIPDTDVIVNNNFLKANPEAVRRVLKAMWRAANLLKTDPNAAASAVKKMYFADLTQSEFEAAYKASLPAFNGGLIPSQDGFNLQVEQLNSAKPPPPTPISVKLHQVYNTAFVKDTQP